MQINIVHLNEEQFLINSPQYKESIRREDSFMAEAKKQKFKLKVWDAIYNERYPHTGCCQSHKQIVRWAKEHEFKRICIAEDDIVFTSEGAWKYFLRMMPDEFDIYFGTSYYTEPYATNRIDGLFDSMSLYVVDERFYDTFLSLPEDAHLDRTLSSMVNEYDFRICQPYVVTQLNGYSFLAKKERNYDDRLKKIELFGRGKNKVSP